MGRLVKGGRLGYYFPAERAQERHGGVEAAAGKERGKEVHGGASSIKTRDKIRMAWGMGVSWSHFNAPGEVKMTRHRRPKG